MSKFEDRNLRTIRYWGRKPPSMISKYVKEFTKEGELVLDPFGGSGNIIRTVLYLRRRAIYVDLNPFAKLIAESTILGCSPKKFKEAIETVIEEDNLKVKNKAGSIMNININDLFSIKCKCGKVVEINSITYTHMYSLKCEPKKATKLQKALLNVIRKHNPITHEELIKQIDYPSRNGITNTLKNLIKKGILEEKVIPVCIKYVKPCSCGRTKLDNPGVIQWIVEEPVYPAYWYPRTELRYPTNVPFLKKRNVERIFEFFDNRTLSFLSYLWYKIRRLDVTSSVKKCLYLTFMATLAKSSKMNREFGGAWPINSYWIPRRYVIKNPFYVFLRTAENFIRTFNDLKYKVIKSSVRNVIEGKANIAFLLADATRLPLPDNSIDYVITDPPHTDEAQFFELSLFYTAWLKSKLDFENEFIVNPRQGKDLTKYFEIYEKFILEIKRVLKPNKYFTVILHEEDESILKKCLEITENLGFKLLRNENIENFYFFTFNLKDKRF